MNLWGLDTFFEMLPPVIFVIILLFNIQKIWNFLKDSITSANNNGSVKEIVFILVVCIIIIISVLMYIYSVLKIKYAYEVGSRNEKSCGNEFLLVDSANYNMFKVIPDQFDTVKVSYIMMMVGINLILVALLFTCVYDTLEYKNINNVIYIWIPVILQVMCIACSWWGSNNIMTEINKPDYLPDSYNGVSKSSFMSFAGFIIGVWVMYIIVYNYMKQEGKNYLTYNMLLIVSIFMVILLWFSFDFVNLYKSARSKWSGYLNTLETQVGVLAGGKTTYQDVYAAYKKGDQFCTYLARNVKSIFYNSEPDPNLDTTPYIISQKNGMELENFLLLPETTVSCALKQTITKYYTDSNSDCTTPNATDGIREILRAIRNWKDPETEINGITNTASGLTMLIILLLLYPMFHNMYTKDNGAYKGSIIVGTSISVLSAFFLAGMYGWINQVA
jgi:hypothetical protein